MSPAALQRFSFLIPGNFAEDDPATGLYETLDLIKLGEALGYDTAWVRQRHLERGISSAPVFLAAASQVTSRIGLGSAVIQMGYETPFRLAEDLAMVDVLSHGRLNVGVSTGAPPFAGLLGDLLRDGDGVADYSHARVERLARALRSEALSAEAVSGNASGAQRPRLQPVAKGLTERLWYGGGSLRSARWAGGAGFHMLTGNIVTGEHTDDFLAAQAALIESFRQAWTGPSRPRVAVGRVVLPTDSADAATRRRYADFAKSRDARTHAPQGPRRTLFLRDIVGSADEIVAALARDPVVGHATELRLELPYEFSTADYAQVMTDFARLVRPRLDLVARSLTTSPAVSSYEGMRIDA